MPLRVMIINHAYAARENRKSLVALAENVDVLALAPDHLAGTSLGLSSPRSDPLEAGDPVVLKRAAYLKQKLLLAPFVDEMRSFGPDVIHVETAPWIPITWETLALARVAAPKAKLVLTLRKNTYVHGRPPFEWVKAAARRLIDPHVHAYVAESEMTRALWENLFGLERRRSYLCPQLGVDTTHFTPADECPAKSAHLTVGYVGRLEPAKGIPELLDAVEEAAASMPLQLHLLGHGSLQSSLRRRAQSAEWLEVHEAVEHEQVAGFLRRCDVFAMPSRNLPDHQEHDGHALMEAMACGLPAIITRSGILPELATTDTAFFVRERHPSDIQRALRQAGDQTLRTAMGGRARSRAVELFSLSALARRRHLIYEEVCA
ncbi:MAG: glycosyltransferase [Myxococcota bacterium]